MLIIGLLALFIFQGKGPSQFLIKDRKNVKVCELALPGSAFSGNQEVTHFAFTEQTSHNRNGITSTGCGVH